MRVYLIASILVLAYCTNDTTWNQNCPATCYSGASGTKGVGACHAGAPRCDDNFKVIACDGEVTPTKEVCNTIDDDCNGFRDDGIRANIIPCLTLGVCNGAVHSACSKGEYKCIWPSNYENPEISCDGLDNNCDGVIDNVPTNGEFCFDADWWKATHPPCQVGIKSCDTCLGQVLPEEEICDDGIDNDCDGFADNRTMENLDIVIMMDPSRSMCPYTASVVEALIQYVTLMDSDAIRWAVVNSSSTYAPFYEVVQDFSDAAETVDTLAASHCFGAGFEVVLDLQFELCERQLLDWRNSGVTLGFSDEIAYGVFYSSPFAIIDSCLANDVTPNFWGLNPIRIQQVVEGAGGQYYDLALNVVDLVEQLQGPEIQCQ